MLSCVVRIRHHCLYRPTTPLTPALFASPLRTVFFGIYSTAFPPSPFFSVTSILVPKKQGGVGGRRSTANRPISARVYLALSSRRVSTPSSASLPSYNLSCPARPSPNSLLCFHFYIPYIFRTTQFSLYPPASLLITSPYNKTRGEGVPCTANGPLSESFQPSPLSQRALLSISPTSKLSPSLGSLRLRGQPFSFLLPSPAGRCHQRKDHDRPGNCQLWPVNYSGEAL